MRTGTILSFAAILLFAFPLSCRAAGGDGKEALPRLWDKGERLYHEGDVAGAEEAFRQALSLDRDQPRSWSYLGGMFFRKGDFDDALQHFKQALMLDPGDARACNNIATTYEHLGEFEKAKTFYVRAIRIDWRYPLPYRNLGVLYATHLQKPELARRFWSRFLELVPTGPDAEAVRREMEEMEKRSGEPREEDFPG